MLTLPRSEIERVAGTPDLSGRKLRSIRSWDKSGVPGEVPGRTRAIAKQVLDICWHQSECRTVQFGYHPCESEMSPLYVG